MGIMSRCILPIVLHLVLACTAALVVAEVTPDYAAVPRGSQWALETFVDLAAADGDVFQAQAELRHHCCHGIADTAARFCDEFKVPVNDCQRLEQFLLLAPNMTSHCECTEIDGLLLSDRAIKLYTSNVRVLHTSENRTQWLKLAVHEGDVPGLDARVDNLCERLELSVLVCETLRSSLREQSLREELKHHWQTLLVHTTKAAVVDHVMTAMESMIHALLHVNKRLEDEIEQKAQAYAKLNRETMEEKHALERRVRELERDQRLRLRSSRDLSISRILNQQSPIEADPMFAEDSLRIPRVHVSNFSYAQYLEFARSSTPVIIQGLADLPGSTGVPPWTLGSLEAACGDAIVTLKRSVSETNDHSATMWAGIEPVTQVPLRHFLRDFTASGSAMKWPYGYADLYLHDTSIRTFCPRLLSGFTIPRYFTDDWLQLLSNSKQTSYWPSLFIGGASTASALHVDWASTAAWMGLLAGRKRWAIAKPSARAALYELFPTDHAQSQGRFNASLLSGAVNSLLRPGEVYEDILEAGEVLFIPADCPHQVQNLDKTIAVAANFVDRANGAAFQQQIQVERDSAAGDQARSHTQTLRRLQDHIAAFQSTGPVPEPNDLSYAQFKERYKKPL